MENTEVRNRTAISPHSHTFYMLVTIMWKIRIICAQFATGAPQCARQDHHEPLKNNQLLRKPGDWIIIPSQSE